ncbi:MAG: class I SAM-dependent methyltransferase [Chlorobiota bacterium]|nr:class I SAM-dependent methyltransferase [Chlorobiota bacterium]QQS67266.1 MAG: class I SAM-dependent methyltransferase [Chlorobiota bacterium]
MNQDLITQEKLKQQVKDYWNEQPCGTQFSDSEKLSQEYFNDIEKHRYFVEPEIFSFAQFTRFHGQKLLEVGVGAGSDFTQWVRAGTKAHGIDATAEGVAHVKKRLELFDLYAEEIKVGDAENLPYLDNFFDIVYSWGVIHHSPDTPKCFREIVRVIKPGGKAKIMVYHRHSLLTYFFWIKYALLKGNPFKSLANVLWNNMESIGTKAYTKKEIAEILKDQPIKNLEIKTKITYYDKMTRFGGIQFLIGRVLAYILGGDKVGWFLTVEFEKNN